MAESGSFSSNIVENYCASQLGMTFFYNQVKPIIIISVHFLEWFSTSEGSEHGLNLHEQTLM